MLCASYGHAPHCNGVGDGTQMIHGSRGHDAGLRIHTACYVQRYGFEAVKELPKAERDKFRMCDLTLQQMRQLMALR